MKKTATLFILIIASVMIVSGCTSDGGGGNDGNGNSYTWYTGSDTLTYNKYFDFEMLNFVTTSFSCVEDEEVGMGAVPDVRASAEFTTAGCNKLRGAYCGDDGAYMQINDNLMDLGEISLDSASVPATLDGDIDGYCAVIGHTYYVKTDFGNHVLFEVTDITGNGVVVNYKKTMS